MEWFEKIELVEKKLNQGKNWTTTYTCTFTDVLNCHLALNLILVRTSLTQSEISLISLNAATCIIFSGSTVATYTVTLCLLNDMKRSISPSFWIECIEHGCTCIQYKWHYGRKNNHMKTKYFWLDGLTNFLRYGALFTHIHYRGDPQLTNYAVCKECNKMNLNALTWVAESIHDQRQSHTEDQD